MTIEQLIFVGLNSYVAALDRDTGKLVWSNKELSGTYVTLLLDGDRLIVSSSGYIYCLSPETGQILWSNPMRGFGIGTPTALASVRGRITASPIEQQVAIMQAAAAASQ